MNTWNTALTLFLFFSYISEISGFLAGSVATCEEEGKIVHVNLVSDDPCIRCICKGGEVTCSRTKCAPLDGCHLILYPKPSNSCCDLCKGCVHNGRSYLSGDSWIDPNDPCRSFTCNAGIVTERVQHCHTPCSNPIKVAGQCCPACTGCSVNGQIFTDGESFQPTQDPCVKCTCHGGSAMCSKQACPVANCPDAFKLQEEGQCCPTCTGSRTVFNLKTHCLFGRHVYRNGATFKTDSCTSCVCKDGTALCKAQSCPLVNCPKEDIIKDADQCCPRCKPKKQCDSNGKTYDHGAEWLKEQCTTCRCDNGVVRCQGAQCNNELECPKSYRMQQLPGECCPKCVESDAVCTVFGDPHYRSFDGKLFNFQGRCKYMLVKTCHDHSFQVRVRNHARLTETYAWTKMATVYINGTKVHLMQRLVVKVNRKRVQIPYEKDGLFTITQEGHSVNLQTPSGVKVIWDGDSYLEVTVPPFYRNKLCGLCGNFNGIETDDFIGPDGQLYLDAELFGDSWRMGSASSCKTPKKKANQTPCGNSFSRKLLAHHECGFLFSHAFKACRDTVDVKPYYRSCVTDVCDCPSNQQCSCEAMQAYSSLCKREGGIIGEWRTPRFCGAPKCPIGAIWDTCGPACPITCENHGKKEDCHKPCIPGCQCPAGLVLHRSRCIKPHKCPKKDFKQNEATS